MRNARPKYYKPKTRNTLDCDNQFRLTRLMRSKAFDASSEAIIIYHDTKSIINNLW